MASCITGEGYAEGEKIRADAIKESTYARKAAALAIAILNAQQIYKNYKAQKDLSQRSINIAKALRGQLKTYFWPRELEFLAEFGGDGETTEPVEVMGKRYGGRIRAAIAKAYADKRAALLCNAGRYCTGALDKALQDLYQEQAFAMANASILGRNLAFSEYQSREDVRMKRRLQAIGLGRGLMGQAATLMAEGGSGLASSATGLTNNLLNAVAAFNTAGDYDKIYDRGDTMRRAGGTFQDVQAARAGNYFTAGDAYLPDGRTTAASLYEDTALANSGYASTTSLMGNTSVWDVATSGFESTSTPMSAADDASDPGGAVRGNDWDPIFSGTSNFSYFDSLYQDTGNTGSAVGTADTVRKGVKVYPVQGGEGGVVTVNMDDFPTLWSVDDQKPKGGA